ncbi:MAG: hypothetical protein KDB22_08930, partial [Planctomycetales bacterium]|nr:hypothetical protein [Planctomycetales bacterium]
MHIRRLAPYVASIALLFTSVTIPTVHAQAERTRPVATVSIASLDKMLKDSRHLLEVCGVAEMGMFVLPMVEHYTQGLDKSKPIGVFVTLDGQMPSALICLPVASRQEFFKGLEGMGIEPDDLGDGVYEVTTPGQTLFAKDANGWLYVAQSEQELLRVPADPAAGLGNLPSRYNVATRIDVQALPPELKAMATEQMRIGFENAMAAQDDQSEEQQAATKAAGEAQLAQIEQ